MMVILIPSHVYYLPLVLGLTKLRPAFITHTLSIDMNVIMVKTGG